MWNALRGAVAARLARGRRERGGARLGSCVASCRRRVCLPGGRTGKKKGQLRAPHHPGGNETAAQWARGGKIGEEREAGRSRRRAHMTAMARAGRVVRVGGSCGVKRNGFKGGWPVSGAGPPSTPGAQSVLRENRTPSLSRAWAVQTTGTIRHHQRGRSGLVARAFRWLVHALVAR